MGERIMADQFQELHEDFGRFSYDEQGFTLKDNKRLTHYNWKDIETIFGLKEDRMATDEICLDIFFNDQTNIRLTESIPGWDQFNKRLSQAISTMSENWIAKVVHPPFATNMTLLFDRDGRTRDQAETAWYVE